MSWYTVNKNNNLIDIKMVLNNVMNKKIMINKEIKKYQFRLQVIFI